MRSLIVMVLLSMVFLGSALAETAPSEQAGKNGVVTCRDKIEATAKFIVSDNDHTANSVWNEKNPNGRLFNSQMAIDGSSVAVMNVIPTKSGTCDSTYTRVLYTKESCPALREKTLKSWRFIGERDGVVFLTGDGPDAMLMSVKSGCIMVKTEVVY
jgi:hypothetical protein